MGIALAVPTASKSPRSNVDFGVEFAGYVVTKSPRLWWLLKERLGCFKERVFGENDRSQGFNLVGVAGAFKAD